MLGIGALMLAIAVLPSGAWGATMTIDEVKKEMAEQHIPLELSRLVMYVPMDQSGVSGQMHMPMTELCASGGKLYPISEGPKGSDMGPVPPGNQYSVQIFVRDYGGYDTVLYNRQVSIPDCK
jgi:hypothetical protein